ncbi:MAG: cellulase family glycosylhydrolase [Deltaproteobacteria bacterium]
MIRRALLSLALPALAACPSPSAADAGPEATVALDAADTVSDARPARYAMPSCSEPASAFAPLATRCQHFVDPQGRVVLLHGINARIQGLFDVSFTDGRLPLEPIPAFTVDDARRMRALGYNLLRMPVNWSGIEPVDATHTLLDAGYLARMHATVDLARDAGILVLIDFHEDAWSKEIGEDGAPLWAIQPPPAMLLGGPLDDLGARRASPQVLAAFATFFSDAPPAIGASLRVRFADMAAAVARSFRGDAAVLGYELFNEPIASAGEMLRFNTETAASVRAADPEHLVVFEPSAARNLLDRAPLAAAPFPTTGGVYAPHVYTLSLNGSDAQRMAMTRSDLRPSYSNAVNEAASWRTPMLITEWGYGPDGIRAADYFAFEQDLQDEFGLSAIFWVWKENSQGAWGLFDHVAATDAWIERPAMRHMLARVTPEAVAGWPTSFAYESATRRFELRYAGDARVTAPTRVYVPAAEDFAATFDVTCDGAPSSAARDATTGLVDVACVGAGDHVVVIVAR